MLLIMLSFVLFCGCQNQNGTNKDMDEIENIWKSYYSPDVPQSEKNKMLTKEYRINYMQRLNSAFNMNEAKLRKRTFKEKLEILSMRYKIDSLNMKEVQLNTFENAFDTLEATSTILISADQGLSRLLFLNPNEAYVTFIVFLSEKSNYFLKEENIWKIDPSKEHKSFDKQRSLLMAKYINEYGSEDAAIEFLIKATTNKPAIWEALNDKNGKQ